VATGFFRNFNQSGAITDVPSSFKRPALTGGQANRSDVFLNAFNSPNYTINKNAAALINSGINPNVNRATFSANQPGLCAVHDNWKASPGVTCTPVLNTTNIQLTVVTTATDRTIRLNKYFANNFAVNR